MTRAWEVGQGCILVFLVWAWMGNTLVHDTSTGVWFAVSLVARVVCACAITGPIYREYLR